MEKCQLIGLMAAIMEHIKEFPILNKGKPWNGGVSQRTRLEIPEPHTAVVTWDQTSLQAFLFHEQPTTDREAKPYRERKLHSIGISWSRGGVGA
jgi:hypothetical protein